ncbi:hypothetical protein CR513_35296, partial [Mucuna pruriens]
MSIFLYLRLYEGTISFRGNEKGNINSIGKIGKPPLTIDNVLYIEDNGIFTISLYQEHLNKIGYFL